MECHILSVAFCTKNKTVNTYAYSQTHIQHLFRFFFNVRMFLFSYRKRWLLVIKGYKKGRCLSTNKASNYGE